MGIKILNPISLILKAIAIIFFYLSILLVWNSYLVDDPMMIFVKLLKIVYIIGISLSFLGIIQHKITNTIEIAGLYMSGIPIIICISFNAMIFFSTEHDVFLEDGILYSIITFAVISIDKFLLRESAFKELSVNMMKALKGEKGEEKVRHAPEEEEEEIEQISKEKVKEKIEKTPSKQKEEKKPLTDYISPPYSILVKIFATMIIISFLSYVYPNLDLSQFDDFIEGYYRILLWISIAGCLISLIGLINTELTYTIETYSVIISYVSITIIVIFQFLLSFSTSQNIEFELAYYLVFFSLLIISLDTFIIREIHGKRSQKDKEKKKKEKEIQIPKKYKRIETKADFPERWAMIHGKKPTEQENFMYFKQLEIEKPSSTFHPNYLHMLIKHQIEENGYRIENSTKPLTQTDGSYNFYDLNGSLKGSIKLESKAKLDFFSSNILIVGIAFLLTSIIVLITNLIRANSLILELIVSLLVFIPLSSMFLIYYFIQSIKQSTSTKLAYRNIYVLEHGIAYYGREYEGRESEENPKIIKNPLIGFKLKLSFAVSVNKMNLDIAKEELDLLMGMIQEILS